MPSKASERIERILPGHQIHPFDFVNNPIFFDPEPVPGNEHTDRLRAATKIANIAADLTMRGMKSIFVPGSMSNGYEATLLAEAYKGKILQNTAARFGAGYLTTVRLKHNVAADELLNRVILPMREQNHQLVEATRRLYPDYSIVGPVDFEGPIRTSKSQNALFQGASFQDWTFESWWGPRVVGSSAMLLAGDHAYSRYANVEEIIGDMIQCGLLDHVRDVAGSGKDYDIVDLNKRQVPLADRAWETAKHIVDVVERGFHTDLAVAALVARFQVDDWLRDKNGPLDMGKVHETLRVRDTREIQRMDHLKELMLPYIAQKCAAWVPYMRDENLKVYFEANVLPITKTLKPADIKALKKEIFAYQPRGGFVHPIYGKGKSDDADVKPDLKASFSHSARDNARTGTDGIYFKAKSAIFEDNLYGQLQVWEQAAISYLIGCTETHRMPAKKPLSAFLVSEPKGGMAAKEWAEAHGISYLKEAQGVVKPTSETGFYQRVILKNVQDTRVNQEKLLQEFERRNLPVGNVVSTLDFLDVREAVQTHRKFVAAAGVDRLSSTGILALEMERLDRNETITVLRPGWQYHGAEIQMMMRAVLHATGQIDRRDEGDKYRMEIYVYDPDARKPADRLKKQSLHDLITTLGHTVEAMLDEMPHVPDRASYVGCARLLDIIDKLGDPGRRNYAITKDPHTGRVTKSEHEIIDWKMVDRDLWSFWTMEPRKKAELSAGNNTLRDRLLEKLQTIGVLEFEKDDLKDLPDEYTKAWEKAQTTDHQQRVAVRQQYGRLESTGPN